MVSDVGAGGYGYSGVEAMMKNDREVREIESLMTFQLE